MTRTLLLALVTTALCLGVGGCAETPTQRARCDAIARECRDRLAPCRDIVGPAGGFNLPITTDTEAQP